MAPLVFASLPLVGAGALLWMRRNQRRAQEVRRAQSLPLAERLAKALELSRSVSTARGGQWELRGKLEGRQICVSVSAQSVLIEIDLGAGLLGAAHQSQFGPGGLNGAGFVPYEGERLPAGWFYSGSPRNLERLPRGLRVWLEAHPEAMIDGGRLRLSRRGDKAVSAVQGVLRVL